MFRDEKNLKDSERKPAVLYGAGSENMSFNLSYGKTNKLITALYMVTDILDKEEPIRTKLRTLGTEIISDTYSAPYKTPGRIAELVSFLDIARTLSIISPMNCDILEKEFGELERAIKEFTGIGENPRQVNLAEFLASPPSPLRDSERGAEGEVRFKGHHLGVQKGGTLMKALSDKTLTRSPAQGGSASGGKGQRRQDILNIIKINGGSATIKDIKDKATSNGHNILISLGEKTLQRELLAMVADGVLKKTGAKRWTVYSIV